MLFMVSHGPPSQEIRQLAGAYGELIHLTHVNSYETLTKQQAAIESEVSLESICIADFMTKNVIIAQIKMFT